MRTLLLALMIALLPIRGWLGDAMALEMARHSLPVASVSTVSAASGATMATQAHCHEAMEAMDATDADAGMQMAMDMSDSPAGHASHDTTGGADHQGCGTCTACQVCHTVALGGMPLIDTVHGAPQAAPAAHASRFASAEPAQGLKPPIS
ncbi:hypothetical protein QTI51_33870 [Variovorax sp. J22G73]|jgi:hypothetical protein|uniref:hypothetical protein n=1 Tax=unclassified Variovorax TaxID=663243 RepID=UPI000D5C3663|nr:MULTISPECIES: hypothetical protein [unclassified Variovorax]MDM0009798.1 hypothetical protein [Variovorax sp. J22R203]MDM0102306.1 hypothetical protein [Variovorax sp. J22G73]